MPFVCRWIADKTVPGGRFFVPGCWGGAMAREGDEFDMCICDRRLAYDDAMQRVDKMEERLAAMEKAIARISVESPVKNRKGNPKA